MPREARSRRKPRGCASCLVRSTVVMLGIVVVAAVIVQVNQRAGLARSREQFLPPGRQYPIDGHLMHVRCTGEGAPTVVIDAGNGGGCLDWLPIQDRLATTTRVCTFDRAGYLWINRTKQ